MLVGSPELTVGGGVAVPTYASLGTRARHATSSHLLGGRERLIQSPEPAIESSPPGRSLDQDDSPSSHFPKSNRRLGLAAYTTPQPNITTDLHEEQSHHPPAASRTTRRRRRLTPPSWSSPRCGTVPAV